MEAAIQGPVSPDDQKGTVKPIIWWPGGKSGMLAMLRELLPPTFNRYLEAFLGGGALYLDLWSLGRITRAWLCDANRELVTLYAAVASDPQAVMAEYDRLFASHSRGFFYKVREADPRDLTEVQVAGRLLYLSKASYNGLYRVDRRGRFKTGLGRDHTGDKRRRVDADNLLRVSEALQSAEIVNTDFSVVLGKAESGDLVTLDPPYIGTCCDYTAAGFTEGDHLRLRGVCGELDSIGVMWMQTNRDCRWVRDLYQGYRLTALETYRRAGNPCGASRAKELVITNY